MKNPQTVHLFNLKRDFLSNYITVASRKQFIYNAYKNCIMVKVAIYHNEYIINEVDKAVISLKQILVT